MPLSMKFINVSVIIAFTVFTVTLTVLQVIITTANWTDMSNRMEDFAKTFNFTLLALNIKIK